MSSKRDIAIIICSRGREAYLSRLVGDIDSNFAPALEAGGMSVCTFVYAQHYPAAFLTSLAHTFASAIAQERLVIIEAQQSHQRIGDVFATAIAAIHERTDYRLAMLMDDDSLYYADPVIDENLRQAARDFLVHEDRAYSIKLGQNKALEYAPFIDPEGPIMPFKEKMQWASRAVLDEVLALPRFAELSIGEDVVISAVAWRGGAERCFGVHGIASFLHLGFEPDGDAPGGAIAGGYGALVGYEEGASQPTELGKELGKYESAFRSGVTMQDILPEIFVGPDHPHYTISGIRPAAVARYGASGSCRRRLHQAR